MIVKIAVDPRGASYFDNVMTKIIIDKRTNTHTKTDINFRGLKRNNEVFMIPLFLL